MHSLPCPWPKKTTLGQSNPKGREANEDGLVRAPLWLPLYGDGNAACLGVQQWCRVLSLNPLYPLSKPRLAALISSCWLSGANPFGFKNVSCVSLNGWLWIGVAAVV